MKSIARSQIIFIEREERIIRQRKKRKNTQIETRKKYGTLRMQNIVLSLLLMKNITGKSEYKKGTILYLINMVKSDSCHSPFY